MLQALGLFGLRGVPAPMRARRLLPPLLRAPSPRSLRDAVRAWRDSQYLPVFAVSSMVLLAVILDQTGIKKVKWA